MLERVPFSWLYLNRFVKFADCKLESGYVDYRRNSDWTLRVAADVNFEGKNDVYAVICDNIAQLTGYCSGKAYSKALKKYAESGYSFGDIRSMFNSRAVATKNKGRQNDVGPYSKIDATDADPELIFDLNRAVGVVWLASLLGPDEACYAADQAVRACYEGVKLPEPTQTNLVTLLQSLSQIYGIPVRWDKVNPQSRIGFNSFFKGSVLDTDLADLGLTNVLNPVSGFLLGKKLYLGFKDIRSPSALHPEDKISEAELVLLAKNWAGKSVEVASCQSTTKTILNRMHENQFTIVKPSDKDQNEQLNDSQESV